MTYARYGSLARLLAAAMAATALLAGALPAGAQAPARTETITYEAIGEGSGVRVTLAPSGNEAFDRGGAVTTASVTQRPAAAASGEGVIGVEQTTVSSEAPPDEDPPSKTGGAFPATGPAGILQISGSGGSADAKSEAADGSPSTEATAEFAESDIIGGTGVLGATIDIGRVATTASAAARRDRSAVTAGATSDAVTVIVRISATALQQLPNIQTVEQQLCGGLAQIPNAGPQLAPACATLFDTTSGSVEFLRIDVGEGAVACGWKNEKPSVSGTASAVTVTLLGVPLEQLSDGLATTQGAGTPLETTVGAGAFHRPDPVDGGDNEEDRASAIAGGAYADLFGKQVQLRFSASSCSVAAKVSVDEVLAATGGRPLLPLAGGALLVAAAILLRWTIRRRDALV